MPIGTEKIILQAVFHFFDLGLMVVPEGDIRSGITMHHSGAYSATRGRCVLLAGPRGDAG